jgi:hypothetical protein
MNKNKMTLREVYKTVGRTLLEQSENDFIAEVDVDVYTEGDRTSEEPLLDVVDRKLRVVYNIDVEYRSYGIKEINAINFRILPFELEDTNREESEVVMTQREVIDASGIRVERDSDSSFGSFYPKRIELRIDRDGNVLVERSTIYF